MGPDSKAGIRVAVIGAGYWGQNLIRNFHALGALAMICESSPDALASIQAKYPGVPCRLKTAEAMQAPDIQAVAIAAPAESHHGLVEQALLAGKHVFVEKPLCLRVEEGAALVALAREKGLSLMVGHLLHYHPAVIKLKELVSEGALGKLQYIYSNRLNLGKIRIEENILWSFAPHDISLLLAVTGQMPSQVSTHGSYFLHQQVADVTVSNFSFANGVSAHIFVSWLHPFKEQKLVLVGDRSMAVFNDTEERDKLLLYPHQVMWKHGLPVPDKKEAVKVDWEPSEPLRNECEHFLGCVRQGLTPRTDGQEGLRVLTVLDACQKSMQQAGRVIELGREGAEPKGYQAHPSALIEEGARIGRGTRIWHFSHIFGGAVIGEDCNIGQNVVVHDGVVAGNGCKIQNNVSLYTGVRLEDHAFCGPSMVFTNVKNPRAEISRMHEALPTLVKRGASIGANATIVCGHTLGRYCFIGAGAVVTGNVPDYALMLGNPARQAGWVCICGERLPQISGAHTSCTACGREYSLANGELRAL